LPGFKKRSFAEFVNEKNGELTSKEGLDLLARMLTFDPVNRITAKEALAHAYFNN